jgi:hypothetical protein
MATLFLKTLQGFRVHAGALDSRIKTPESTASGAHGPAFLCPSAASASGLLNQMMLNCHVNTVKSFPEEPTA